MNTDDRHEPDCICVWCERYAPVDPSPDLTEYVVPSTAGTWETIHMTGRSAGGELVCRPTPLFTPHWAEEES